MGKLKLRAKDLRRIGYEKSSVISVAMQVMHKHYKHHEFSDAMTVLESVLQSPEEFSDDPVLGKITVMLIAKTPYLVHQTSLRTEPAPLRIFGKQHIETGAMQQMETAVRLPVAVSGALMPDAHQGYGLPIGGVLAVDNAVIPYAVGVDIGCRMCLTIYDAPAEQLLKRRKIFESALMRHTYFGSGRDQLKAVDHEIIERPEFDQINLHGQLRKKAALQLGTSGSGNHFVEFGEVEILSDIPEKNLKAGTYIGLLSHSGSRGLGATVAQHFTTIAMERCKLPREAQHLAWLSLDTDEGNAYWKAMNLAGDYAEACHEIIHQRITGETELKPLAQIANHHNFAWKEMVDGTELVVHRKGATPAGKGTFGIIPGSMTSPGYLVRGKGETASLQSAAHGAGRKMSRGKAMQSVTHQAMKDLLRRHHVTLIGGGLDEAPQAYKDIDMIMASQMQLVDIAGKFQPRIVRMDG